jgi:hypothetical protein
MTRGAPTHRFTWPDALVLVATLALATWVALHTVYELESTLDLKPKQQVFDDMSVNRNQLVTLMGRRPKSLREQYAEVYPWSPLAAINRMPGVSAAWTCCARTWERVLPPLTIASLGIGIVILRRPGRPPGRVRRGPGAVAGAIGLVISATDLIPEFVGRRFDLMRFGNIHDPLANVWEGNAFNVGVAILVAWALLALAGRWKPGPGWRERLGLGLGAIWLMYLCWAIVLVHLAQF